MKAHGGSAVATPSSFLSSDEYKLTFSPISFYESHYKVISIFGMILSIIKLNKVNIK